MREVSGGVWHWTALHPGLGVEVSSYFLDEERVLIDPMIPREGLSWFNDASPQHILLTSRHHDRDSWRFQAAFGCRVHCGVDAVDELDGRGPLEPFAFGTRLPGEIVAYEIGAIFPDETAFHIPRHGSIACGDGVIRRSARDCLSFVPDQYMEAPGTTKLRLRTAYRAVLELEFDTLLLAHGDPIVGEGKQALKAFVERDFGRG